MADMTKKLRLAMTASAFISTVVYAPHAMADLYKCTVNGKVQYQQMPCAAGEEKALDDSNRKMRQKERDAKEQLAKAEKNAASEQSGVSMDEVDRKAKAEQAMRAYFDGTLVDPSSAQFRNVKVYLNVPGSKLRTAGSKTTPLVDVVCGEVNSKNRMGGYVGFRQFYWDSDEKKGVGPSDDKDFGPILQSLATRTCAGLE